MRAGLTAAAAVLPAFVSACAGPLAIRGELLDAEAAGRVECIAVMPFADATGAPRAGEVVAHAVATALLTSGRFNVLGPDEVAALFDAMQTPLVPPATADSGRAYGRALGAPAVLVGTVTELEAATHGTSSVKHPVVGFVAELVETASGRVLWSAAASNFHHDVLLEVAEPREELLRTAVRAATADLVAARPTRVAQLGPCAELQVKLWRGQIQPPAVPPSLPTPAPLPAPPPSPDPRTARAESTALLESAAGTPPATPQASLATATAPVATPALPLPGQALPALPALPPIGPTQGGAAPSTSSAAAPPSSSAALADAPPAPSPGLPPARLLTSLRGGARDLVRRLYGRAPVVLRGAFPNYAGKSLTLSPKAKRLLDSLAAIMKATPTLNVRLDTKVGLTGKPADGALLEIARQQTELMRSYLLRSGIAASRLDAQSGGATPPRGKRPAKTDNVVAVVVLRY